MTNQNNASFDPIFPSSSSPPPPLPPPPVSSLPNPNHHRKKRTKLNKALLEPTPIPPPILGNLVSFPLPVGSSSSSSMPTKNAADTGSVKKNKGGGGGGGGGRKLDPSAPKITKPCTECGKKFSSWKALFGHMRCHPERDWRGINPPPNHRRRPPPPLTMSSCPPSSPPPHLHRTHIGDPQSLTMVMTAEDHEVADCLLFLANYAAAVRHESPVERNWENRAPFVGEEELCGAIIPFHHHNQEGEDSGRFECSSCKKVFGSFQALGGHRASHKNVKGCFQNDTVFPEDFRQNGCLPGSSSIGGGGYDAGQPTEFVAAGFDGGNHKCSICLKVFPSGQALGGHKRCHWDNQRGNQHQQYQQGSQSSSSMLMVDLNLPAPGVIPPAKEEEEHEYSSSPVSRALGPALDLRLGL